MNLFYMLISSYVHFQLVVIGAAFFIKNMVTPIQKESTSSCRPPAPAINHPLQPLPVHAVDPASTLLTLENESATSRPPPAILDHPPPPTIDQPLPPPTIDQHPLSTLPTPTADSSLLTLDDEDDQIFQVIDLNDKTSIDSHFKFIRNKGRLKPTQAYTGYSRDYHECLQKIREWRQLSKEEQLNEKKKYSEMGKREKKKFKDNIQFLMTTEKSRLFGTLMDVSVSSFSSSSSTTSPSTSTSRSSSSSQAQLQQPKRASVRNLIARSTASAERNHLVVIDKHVGLVSSTSERTRARESRRQNSTATKKRRTSSKTRAERPTKNYQAGDVISRKAMQKAMKQIAHYSDTISTVRPENVEQCGPRNKVVTMVLNEVKETKVSGGRVSSKSLKKDKPEFILICDNMLDCFDVVKAFSAIHSRNVDKNRKDEYDVHTLMSGDADDGLLTSSVAEFIKKDKEKKGGKATIN